MRKKSLFVGFVVVLLMIVAVSAYAGGDTANCPVHGFFESLGGFLYNALPWNWGNWMGK